MDTRRGNPNHTQWSDEEVEVLKEIYSKWPIEYDRLPSRPRQSIHTKAYRLGLSRGRVASPQFAHVTSAQWAWLAGFIDGEGTIWFNTGVRRSRQSYNQPIISVCNTHQETMRLIDRLWPGGSWGTREPGDEGAYGQRKKQLVAVRWGRTATVMEMLVGLIPHLITKVEPAKDLLQRLERFNALT